MPSAHVRVHLAVILVLSAACATSPANKAQPERFEQLLQRYWEDTLVLNPIMATRIGDDRYNDRLPNFLSVEYRESEKAYAEKYLRELAAFDRARLSGQDRLSYDILHRELQETLEAHR